jgi:hypothetical protein
MKCSVTIAIYSAMIVVVCPRAWAQRVDSVDASVDARVDAQARKPALSQKVAKRPAAANAWSGSVKQPPASLFRPTGGVPSTTGKPQGSEDSASRGGPSVPFALLLRGVTRNNSIGAPSGSSEPAIGAPTLSSTPRSSRISQRVIPSGFKSPSLPAFVPAQAWRVPAEKRVGAFTLSVSPGHTALPGHGPPVVKGRKVPRRKSSAMGETSVSLLSRSSDKH